MDDTQREVSKNKNANNSVDELYKIWLSMFQTFYDMIIGAYYGRD